MIRKFYDDAANESGGNIFSTAERVNLEDLLKKQPEDSVSRDGNSEEAKTDEEKPEDNSSKAEEIELKQEEQPEKTVEVKAETSTQQNPDWKSLVLSNKKEILELLSTSEEEVDLGKLIQQDEYLKKAFIHRKEKGNLNDFFESAGKDWDKPSHEDLVMEKLVSMYSHLPNDKAVKLAKSDFSKMYEYKEDLSLTDEENEENAELVAIKLEAEGEKIRQEKKSKQKEYLDNYKFESKEEAFKNKQLQQQKEEEDRIKEYHQMIDSVPAINKLVSDKKIVVGSGKEAFNMEVDTTKVVDIIKNPAKFFQLFGEPGREDWAAVIEAVVFALDRNKYNNSLTNHGRSLGAESVSESLSNKNTQAQNGDSAFKGESWKQIFANAQPIKLG